jgi:hypothetical protein
MSIVRYRDAEQSDIAAIARIRAAEWGTEEYWTTRIAGYINRDLHPQKALMPRVVYVALENDLVAGFVAGHLTRRYECDGELEWIKVICHRRGSGVASELLLCWRDGFLNTKRREFV